MDDLKWMERLDFERLSKNMNTISDYIDEPDYEAATDRIIEEHRALLAVVRDWLRLREWVVEAGGTSVPLCQDVITKFAEMQAPIVEAAQRAVELSERP